jgi:hypothetical protein
MPTILRIGPHRFFFYSNEGHEPAHIHVETAERTAKFWLNPVELAFAKRYNAKELNQLSDLVEKNLNLFLDKWNEYFG